MKNKRQASTYETMHKKLRRLRGRAAENPCQHCQVNPAQHWALSADATEILIQVGTNEDGRAFSKDVDDYLSLCAACHSAYDVENGLVRGKIGRPRLNLNCTLAGCDNPHKAKGLCGPHYEQKRRAK